MSRRLYLVDAFAHGPFTGNPAGVCPLDGEPDEAWMQSLAHEMNQAETAFFWPEGDAFRLRWFTPACEVDLCGHATLASAHVVFSEEGCRSVRFLTRSGALVCDRTEGGIRMDFPNEAPSEVADSRPARALGIEPTWSGANRMDWFVALESEEQVRALVPDMTAIQSLGKRGLVVTAPGDGDGADFVSRFFAPQSGVPEDHVTGSAHCALAPFWAERLGRSLLTGYQASPRGGYVTVEANGDRVALEGRAFVALTAELHV